MYFCHYIVLVMIGWCFGIVFGELCAWTKGKLCKSRSGESISSKRELQNLISGFGSRCSLRRPGCNLSDRHSRLGENGSPKRGRDENLHHFERDFSSKREVWVLSYGHSRLSEFTKLNWCISHWILVQARCVCYFKRRYGSPRREDLA